MCVETVDDEIMTTLNIWGNDFYRLSFLPCIVFVVLVV